MAELEKIILDGYTYELDLPGSILGTPTYAGPARKKYPQKLFRVDDSDFWSSWTMPSFHGGERLERILSDDDLKSFRYYDAEGLDQALLSKWGELKLAPATTRSVAVSSTSIPMTVSSDGTKLIVGLSVSPYIKVWTSAGGWVNYSTGTMAGSGAITDLITAGSVYYAVRGGGILTCVGDPATADWTAVGSYTTAVGIAYISDHLYVAKSDGIVNHTDSAEVVTTQPVSFIAGHRGILYAGVDRRLFRYDGVAWYLDRELPMGFNMTALVPYRDILLILGYFKIRTGYKGAVYYVLNGSNINHLYGLGDYSADHRIYAACGSDDEIFFANPKRGGVDRYGMESGGITNGPLWGAVGSIPFKSMAVCEGYLWVGRYDANVAGNAQTTGNDTTHIKLAAASSASNDAYNGKTITFTAGTGAGQTTTITDYDGTTKIAVITTVTTAPDDTTDYFIGTDGIWCADIATPAAWNTTGWLKTPNFDYAWSNDLKLFGSVYVEHKALVQGESITIDYSVDGGTTFYSVGVSSAAGSTSKTFPLDNITGQRIMLKVTLAGPGTSTPTLTKLVVKAAPLTDDIWMWDLRLLLTPIHRGKEGIAKFEGTVNLRRQISFADADGQKYNVAIDDSSIEFEASQKQDNARIKVRLRQI
jgi:hypothetical protein